MLRCTFITFLLFVASSHAAVDYTTQIKPLLQQHCVKCHGATTQKSQLKLDTAAAARTGGKHGTALPDLLVQVVSGTHAEIPQMPYKRGPLDSAQIALIRQWVAEGAQAPAEEAPSDDRHWAFIAPVKAPLPQSDTKHPIDAFIRSSLSKAGLEPSPPAAPATLIRRLHLDLTGLPPTPAEVAAFLKQSASSIADLAARLLASKHYGERWGRWWLDQARYGDSNGYSIDAPRSMWPYRDYVVNALNQDKPFDQFTLEQLAGDMLPKPSREQLIATGFHRNTQINQEGGIDKEQFRIESIFDRVATTGTVWLGLTIGCAQCHDHKFDPISQREYYQLFAFLNNQDEPTLPVPDPGQDLDKLKAEHAQVLKQIDAHIKARIAVLQEWEKTLGDQSKKLVDAEALKSLAKPAAKRAAADQRILFKAMTGTSDSVFNPLYDRHLELDNIFKNGTTTLVMKELPQPRKTTLFIKGDFTRPSEEVQPGVLAVLPALPAGAKADRLALARWLIDPKNPLTARVIVNRVWQQYFGRGLVSTENDFGTMGRLPTHPELLDWLAVDFMEHGWSLKHLHKLIVTSATYQQASTIRPSSARIDPNNDLLWRQNRLRLDAEVVRDVCLAASGLLSPKMGGAPVYPPIPEGVMSLGQVKRAWPLSKGSDRYRRGIYTFIFRATPPPALSVFDAPDGFSTCTRRIRSNTPLQALTLLNDSAYVEFAQALAARLIKEAKTDDTRIDRACQLCLSRPPLDHERKALTRLLAAERQANATEPQAWQAVARVMLNLDETITRE
ncbi:PSD1 and planctomycete cytochrome C domain-containing protein [Prosthecobacter sp.]|uniref:PSD1 and planctomycete cytochrome C domain-containing protein n=1 Tax=Prosthecobacter sp. TaxID=1965333 RepID=UPI003784A27E